VTFIARRPLRDAVRKNNFLFYREYLLCQTGAMSGKKSRATIRFGTGRGPTIVGRSLVCAQDLVMANVSKLPPEVVSRLRELVHDLSNSIETIMQASYLLSQLELQPHGKKWVELIEEAAQGAAQINKQLREVLRG